MEAGRIGVHMEAVPLPVGMVSERDLVLVTIRCQKIMDWNVLGPAQRASPALKYIVLV